MSYLRFLSLIGVFAAMPAPFLQVSAQDEEDEQEKEVAILRAAIKKAHDEKTRAIAYRKFFEHFQEHQASGNFYHRMRSDPDNIIALHAAYRVMTKRPHPPELAHHRHFIGFVEGRTGIVVPDRWRLTLIRRIAVDHPEIGQVDREFKRAPKLAARSQNQKGVEKSRRAEGFILENLESIRRVDGRVVLDEGGVGRVELTEKLFQEIVDSVKHYESKQMHMWIEGNDVFFLLNSGMEADQKKPFMFFRINQRQQKVVWKVPLWVWIFRGISGPLSAGLCKAEIVVNRQSGTVGIFVNAIDLHMEGFDLRDGTAKFRFSCDLWPLASEL